MSTTSSYQECAEESSDIAQNSAKTPIEIKAFLALVLHHPGREQSKQTNKQRQKTTTTDSVSTLNDSEPIEGLVSIHIVPLSAVFELSLVETLI